MTGPVWFAFGLTLFAGLATGLGSVIAFFAKRSNTRFLAFSLGFSAGVMLYVSFVEIFAKARETLCGALGSPTGYITCTAAFFAGILLTGIIDKLVPEAKNPHEIHRKRELEGPRPAPSPHLLRTGLFTALAIGIHNFPEGLATFIAALAEPKLGIAIAVAIAIHNIPEGISVSIPIYYAVGSKKKAFFYSFLSGLAEPAGALIGYIFLRAFFSDLAFGLIFAGVAGIMVYISLDELLPAAEKYGEHHLSIYGLVLGMAVMAASLLLFA